MIPAPALLLLALAFGRAQGTIGEPVRGSGPPASPVAAKADTVAQTPSGQAEPPSAAQAGTQVEAPPAAAIESVPCYPCFWKNHPSEFRDELLAFYDRYAPDDPLIDADRRYILSRVRGDLAALCEARRAFEARAEAENDPLRQLLARETVAFTAEECGADPRGAFRAAAAAARAAREPWKARVYRDAARGRFRPRFGNQTIEWKLSVPSGTRAFVLGASTIRVRPGERIGVQVERTARDWISYRLDYDLTGRPPAPDSIIEWHEGARIRDILAAVPATVVPLEGVLAVHRGDRWFAADGSGIFRFEVLPDKIQYPSTRAWRGLALLVDTHGLSSLVEPAVRSRADLVIGCGDHPEKMKAAYHLAARGTDVYFPCDRFVGEIVGYDAPGTLIGSAPVRPAQDGGAIIGDRPVTFFLDETFVVEDTLENSDDRYYDAAARYFRRLAGIVPLRLEMVVVDGTGGSERVVRRAQELGATAIALRVMTDEDAAPVRAWLAASPRHRAVLFHTAPYPAGHALFTDFPGQTTFGDPRPRFLTK